VTAAEGEQSKVGCCFSLPKSNKVERVDETATQKSYGLSAFFSTLCLHIGFRFDFLEANGNFGKLN
jgi:hypothetical protein